MKALREAFRTGNLPKSRIEAFSDGVIAVAITLLVLEIKIPDPAVIRPENLGAFLLGGVPKFLCYLIAFVFIAIWWVAHHQLFHVIQRSDRGLLWLNSLFLMWLALFPFPTAVLGEYPDSPVAMGLFGTIAFLTGLTFLAIRWYVSFKARLIDPSIPQNVLRSGLRRGAVSPLLYGLTTIVGFFVPKIAFALFILIPFYYFFPSLLERHQQEESEGQHEHDAKIPRKENDRES